MSTKLDLDKGIIPLSKFRQLSKAYLKQIHETQNALVLTQNGQSTAILLTPSAYQKLEYERALFRAIAEGEKDAAEGRTVDHDQLFSELLS